MPRWPSCNKGGGGGTTERRKVKVEGRAGARAVHCNEQSRYAISNRIGTALKETLITDQYFRRRRVAANAIDGCVRGYRCQLGQCPSLASIFQLQPSSRRIIKICANPRKKFIPREPGWIHKRYLRLPLLPPCESIMALCQSLSR